MSTPITEEDREAAEGVVRAIAQALADRRAGTGKSLADALIGTCEQHAEVSDGLRAQLATAIRERDDLTARLDEATIGLTKCQEELTTVTAELGAARDMLDAANKDGAKWADVASEATKEATGWAARAATAFGEALALARADAGCADVDFEMRGRKALLRFIDRLEALRAARGPGDQG